MVGLRLALAGLAAVTVLAACDDPEPEIRGPDRSVSSPPTTSISATVTPDGPLSARKTIPAWLEAWSGALTSGDTTAVEALTSPRCDSCQRIFLRLANIYAKGGRLQTVGWKASKIARDPHTTQDLPAFIMRVTQARQLLLNEKGEVIDDTPKRHVPMRMTFENETGTWALARLQEIK